MTTSRPERVAKVGATLGEGPIWIAHEQAVWFVDIKSHRIHRFDPATGTLKRWNAPQQVGWILPTEGGGFVTGLQSGPARFDPVSGDFGAPLAVPGHCGGDRLNDAATDRHGRLWFGTMDDAETDPHGRLFMMAQGGIRDSGVPPVTITNGPAIAPDGATLYYVDTLGRTVFAAPLHDDGTLGPPRIFARIEDGAGYPDGPVVDAAGHVWIGLFGGWGVRRYAPDGTHVETVRLPTANVTKITFGGPDLRTAFATTARKGLSMAARLRQPAGDLFAFDVDSPGQSERPIAANLSWS